MIQDHVVRLEAGTYQLDLCPEGGGCITAFRYRGIDLFRPATEAYWREFEPREAASFPLVPYSNRIADGRGRFEGRTYRFPVNMPPEPHSIHGDGWQAAWTVEASAPARAVLAHAPADTPFPYSSRQTFELTEDGLALSLEIVNTGQERIPVGFGHHPYFPRTEGLTLTTAVSAVWLPDARQLPEKKVPVPKAWDFRVGKRLAPLDLDYDFTGFDGKAMLHWPETGIRLMIGADPVFCHLVVYVPPGQDFVCVEPVSHVGNAINLADAGRTDTGLQVLEPGAALNGRMGFRVEP